MKNKPFELSLPKPGRWLAVSAVVLLGACATPLPNAKLEAARTSYQQAAGDAQVVRSAQVELNKAQQALMRAEAARKAGDDEADVNHYADLARTRTEVAVQAGKAAAAAQALTSAASQREQILLQSRTAEADAQRLRANSSAAQAEAARMQAEQARQAAEQQLVAARAAQAQSGAAQARAQALEAQLAAMQAKQTDRGMVLTLGDVLFDTGRAELKAGADRTLEQLATFLKQNADRTVQIEGYTDSTGSEQTNQVLSERRAIAVKNALTDRGIENSRISARGMGPSNPVASNATQGGRQQNRRVEIVLPTA